MTENKTEYHQSLVSRFPDKNAALTAEQRFVNLEHDMLSQGDCLKELVDQNNKYAKYLDKQIKAEDDVIDMRKKIQVNLATAGIIGFVTGLIGIIWYAITQWANK